MCIIACRTRTRGNLSPNVEKYNLSQCVRGVDVREAFSHAQTEQKPIVLMGCTNGDNDPTVCACVIKREGRSCRTILQKKRGVIRLIGHTFCASESDSCTHHAYCWSGQQPWRLELWVSACPHRNYLTKGLTGCLQNNASFHTLFSNWQ